MCGRYSLRRIEEIVAAMMAMPELDDFYLAPRYNIAPSQQVPMVRLHNDKRVIGAASWGFVPWFIKGKPKAKPINARSETVATSGMFRDAFKSKRCLLPADGFYEWLPGTPKQPFFFHKPDDTVFAFAGLWSVWEGESTCLHLTTTPNEVVKPIHDRMPVMLQEKDYATWLDPKSTPSQLADLLRPYPAEELLKHEVSTRVNTPKIDDPSLVVPLQ